MLRAGFGGVCEGRCAERVEPDGGPPDAVGEGLGRAEGEARAERPGLPVLLRPETGAHQRIRRENSENVAASCQRFCSLN